MKLISTFSLIALLAACGNRLPDDSDTGTGTGTTDPGTETGTTDPGTETDPPADITPISDLNTAAIALDSWVTIEGVVTAGTKYGVVLQDANAVNSGVWVFLGGAAGNSWTETYAIGDALRISGTYTEYIKSPAWPGDATNTLDTITELGADPLDVLPVTSTLTITPMDISGVDFTSKAALEPYELTVVSIAGTLAVTAIPDAGSFWEWYINDTILIDNATFDGNAIAGVTGAELAVGQTFTKITGFLNYDYGNFKIAPRVGSDIEGFVAAP